jgi:integrase
MPALWSRLAKEAGSAADALRLVILTAARREEVLDLTWGELDLDAALWTVPAARMKMRDEHRVPLLPAALDLLRGLQRHGVGELVFQGSKPGQGLGNMALAKVMDRIDAKTAEGVRAVPHGFRSSFETWAGETGKADDVTISLATAHVSGRSKTKRAYDRGDRLDSRRTLMAQWADYLEGVEADGNVVSFPAAA